MSKSHEPTRTWSLPRSNFTSVFGALFGAATLFGCAEREADSGTPTANPTELIGGTAALERFYDFVGSPAFLVPRAEWEAPASGGVSEGEQAVATLSTSYPNLSFRGPESVEAGYVAVGFCSGTGLTAHTVLTAKHCTEIFPQIVAAFPNAILGYLIGGDQANPRRFVRMLDYAEERRVPRTQATLGSDLAIMFMERGVPVLPRVRIEAIDESEIGIDGIAIGYGPGEFDVPSSSGIRRTGVVSLRAVFGNAHDVQYGSYEGYLAALGVTSDTPDEVRDFVDAQYLLGPMMPRYEALWGPSGLPGDDTEPQACFGDSGGPVLIPRAGGAVTIAGVVSRGIFFGDGQAFCPGGGAVYASFGPTAKEFVDVALACSSVVRRGQGGGVCQRDRVVQCSSGFEAGRPLERTEVDCRSRGLHCGRNGEGLATCIP